MATCTNLPFDFKELRGSAEEDFDFKEGKWTTKRIFFGPWNLRFDFLNSLFSTIYGGGGNSVISLPSYYPEAPLLVPVRFSNRGRLTPGHNVSTDLISYDFVEITVTYESIDFDISGQGPQTNPNLSLDFTYLTEEFTTRVEILQIPSQYTKVSILPEEEMRLLAAVIGPDGSTPDPDQWDSYFKTQKRPGTNFYETILDVTITEHYVPFPKWDKIFDAASKVNLVDIAFPSGRILKPESVLYHGPAGVRRTSIVGSNAWEIQHKFSIKLSLTDSTSVIINRQIVNVAPSWNSTIDIEDPIKRTVSPAGVIIKEYNYVRIGVGQGLDPPFLSYDVNTVFGSY